MKAAQVLSRAFYAGLAGYLPVDAALGEARKAALLASEMAGTGSGCDWALPVLFSRSGDNALLSEPAPLARPQIERAPFEPETVLIPAGRFVMGRDAGDGVGVGESPQHTLELPAYRIGRTPVTNAQYAQFVHATRRAVTSETGWQLAVVGQVPPPGREQHPVVGVTWDDAVAYCRWLSEHSTKGDRSAHASSNDHDAAVSRRRYRLPSEAEWERAARGPGGRIYPWGDKFDAQRCNAEPAGLGKVSAVGTFSPDGDTPEGAVDMAGNVWEWTGTAWGRDVAAAEYMYPYRVDDGREDPQPADGPLREYRICRGGSFREQAERVTGSARSRHLADSRAGARGFRVVMEVE